MDKLVYELTIQKGETITILLTPFHPQDVRIQWRDCKNISISNAIHLLFADPIMDIANIQVQFPGRSKSIHDTMQIQRKYSSQKYFETQ